MSKTKRNESKRVDNLERKLAELERKAVEAEFSDDNQLARKLWADHARLLRKIEKNGSDYSSSTDN